jgi:hypothetical protein
VLVNRPGAKSHESVNTAPVVKARLFNNLRQANLAWQSPLSALEIVRFRMMLKG